MPLLVHKTAARMSCINGLMCAQVQDLNLAGADKDDAHVPSQARAPRNISLDVEHTRHTSQCSQSLHDTAHCVQVCAYVRACSRSFLDCSRPA